MTKPVEPTGATFFGFRFGGPVVQAASTVVEEEESEEESVDESEDESEYESTMNGDAGEEEEYIGEILLDGFVDEGCGAAARIGKKRPLGELSIEILSMRGITPDGKTERAVPSVMFKMGGSWAHLPASARGAPPRGVAKSSPPCTTPRTPRTSASSTAPTPTHRWVSSTSPFRVCLATFRWCPRSR